MSNVNYVEGKHYLTEEPLKIKLENNRIVAVDKLPDADHELLPWIAPGLVDLQINGYQGMDFNTLPLTEELITEAVHGLWKEGVTSFYPTVITNGVDEIAEAMRIFAKACNNNEQVNQSIAGIHLEGPFISPEDGPRGAHGKEFVRAPEWSLFEKWQQAAEGRIKILTLSPEWPNSTDFIRKCTEEGIVVSIGHTSATPEQIQDAVRAGARMSTHLGNGAHLMLKRHPNYLWEQLAADDLWSSFIADGFHLPDSVMKVILKVKKEKAVLVSDAVYLSGLEPGEYETHIGGKVVLTREGKLHLADNPNLLAGSAQMLTWGIQQLVTKELCTMGEAWQMASIQPLACMGMNASLLEIGTKPDLVVFEWNENQINIKQTFKSGEKVNDVIAK